MDAVLNWTWQGMIIALVTTILRRSMTMTRAHIRYRMLWMSLLSVLLLPIAPSIWSIAAASSIVPAATAAEISPAVPMSLEWWPSTTLTIGLWLAWSSIYSLRVARAWWSLRRALHRSRPASSSWQTQLEHWTQLRERGRRTQIVVSHDVRAAAVLGLRSPAIALSPVLFECLSNAELDRVVVHEWAHVQRRDDLANVAQVCTRVVAGWHPAVWWLNRQLDSEREMACDETAVVLTGSAKAYAACLVKLAGLPGVPLRSNALAVGASTRLGHRIVRILSMRNDGPGAPPAPAITAALAVCVLALAVGGIDLVVPIAARDGSSVPTARRFESTTVTSVAPRAEIALFDERPVKHASPATRPARQTISVIAHVNPDPPHLVSANAEIGATAGRVPLSLVPSTVTLTPLPSPIPSTTSTWEDIENPPPIDVTTRTPWGTAAEAGVAAGRASQKAAVATAGLFTRFGRKVADAF